MATRVVSRLSRPYSAEPGVQRDPAVGRVVFRGLGLVAEGRLALLRGGDQGRDGGPTRRLAAAVRWVARATVAFVIFAWYHGVAYLDILAAPRFLHGDWTTYIVSSNYLRTSPLLTMPIAKLPGYIAPVGTHLATTDSLPVISPLYRLLLGLWPDRPVQLVGWEVLAAIVLTFLTVARFLDAVTDAGLRPLPRELLTLALATVVTVAPFWAVQDGHPALMQQWILVWALAGAL